MLQQRPVSRQILRRPGVKKQPGAGISLEVPDLAFPDGLATEDEFRAFADNVDAPVMANMTEFGRTLPYTADRFQDMGYSLVIWPVSQLRVAAKAMEGLYAHIMAEGGTQGIEKRMMTRAETYDLIGYHDYERLDAGIVESSLPQAEK